jgi:PII-like signaling protein
MMTQEAVMQGYQLTFFTQQDRKHGSQLLAEWIMEESRKLGIGGATLTASSQGFGHHGRLHSVHFFDLADQPVEITMAVSAEHADRLFALLIAERVQVFYVKSQIEYGMLGVD